MKKLRECILTLVIMVMAGLCVCYISDGIFHVYDESKPVIFVVNVIVLGGIYSFIEWIRYKARGEE